VLDCFGVEYKFLSKEDTLFGIVSYLWLKNFEHNLRGNGIYVANGLNIY